MVEGLFEERDNFYLTHPEEYELMAGKRDVINARLRPLTYIKELSFDIVNFYEVDFWITNDIITYGIYGTEYYAIEALAKVLYDLGDTFKDEKFMSDRLKRWSKLKRWEDYNRFNKPTK